MFIHPARCSIGVAVAAKAEAACGCSPCAWLPLLCSVGLCTPLSQAPLPPATILPGVSPLVGWQVPLFFWKPPCATPDLAGDLHWIQPLGLHGSVCYRVVCWNLLIAGKWPSVCALSKKSKSPFPDYSPEALLHGKEANQGWKLEFTNLEKSIVFFFYRFSITLFISMQIFHSGYVTAFIRFLLWLGKDMCLHFLYRYEKCILYAKRTR